MPTGQTFGGDALQQYRGAATINYGPDGEGRVSTMTSAVTATNYNTSSQVTGLTLASGDSDAFGFDPNTGRPTSYAFTVSYSGSAHTETGTITNNQNGTMQKLAISDPFYAADSQTCLFTYDDQNRLAQDNCSSVWGAQYNYDAYGNISKSMIAGSPGTTFAPSYGTAATTIASFRSPARPLHTMRTAFDGGRIPYIRVGCGREPDHGGWRDGHVRRPGAPCGAGVIAELQPNVFSPANPRHPMGTAPSLTATGIRLPLPGGGEVTYNSSGLYNYRHPNWQGSQPLLS